MDTLHVFLSALFSAVILFILTKLMGEKQISQLGMFDYIAGITIGSIAAEMATELEKNPVHPIVAMCVYAALDISISFFSRKSLRFKRISTGSPLLLMDNGVIFKNNLTKARMDLCDFLMICRSNGYFNAGDIQTAVLEHNGSVSFLPVSGKRPATPDDMSLSPQQETLPVTLILDGKVQAQTLKQSGLDKKWLTRQLDKRGYKSAKDVLLAQCDNNNNLSIYPR